MTRSNPKAAGLAASVALIEAAFPGPRGAPKRSVLTHALQCFNETGLEASTIDDLRQRSGQSVGTIYHHFRNKEGVVAALFFVGLDDQSRVIAQAMEEAGGSTQRMVAALIQAYMSWAQSVSEMARFVLLARESVAKGPSAELLTQRLHARYQPLDDCLARAMSRGEIQQLPEELIPALILGPAESYCRGWLAGRRASPPGECAQVLADAAWRSLMLR